jgi:hypothetical protein
MLRSDEIIATVVLFSVKESDRDIVELYIDAVYDAFGKIF